MCIPSLLEMIQDHTFIKWSTVQDRLFPLEPVFSGGRSAAAAAAFIVLKNGLCCKTKYPERLHSKYK